MKVYLNKKYSGETTFYFLGNTIDNVFPICTIKVIGKGKIHVISKFIKSVLVTMLAIGLLTFQVNTAEAAPKVMWGKTELKLGQIGKVTVLEKTSLVKQNTNGTLKNVRTLKKGEEYRVYSYKDIHGGLYGVGGGSFVQKNSKIKYETPSKSKLALLHGTTPNPSSPSGIVDSDYEFNLDLILVAQDGTYLGKLTTNKYDSESIFNEYGSYGSEYSTKSIWNEYGAYGSEYRMYSPFNSVSTTPPAIVHGNDIVGYLSVNLNNPGAVHPDILYSLLLKMGY